MPSRPGSPPPGNAVGPARRGATAHDVARLAGVSQSAVSRSFTQGASVSAATRRKVVEAAAVLGYQPNLAARSLITGRSGMVGVALSYLENQFYPHVLEQLSQAFARVGYRVLLFVAKRGEPSDPVLDEVLRRRLDAVVLLSAALSSRFDAKCRQAGVPVVLLNRHTAGSGASSVTGDNRGGGAALAAFLLAGGHRRFAFMAGLQNASTSVEREAGFRDHLAGHGVGTVRRVAGDYDFAAAAAAARALFSDPDPPDALFCANDHMALAAINVARAELGLDVGRAVSIVGFDDAGPAAWPLFGLTTFVQPVGAMVARVVAVTLACLAEPATPVQRHVLPGAIVVRSSARRPAHGIVPSEGGETWQPPPEPGSGPGPAGEEHA